MTLQRRKQPMCHGLQHRFRQRSAGHECPRCLQGGLDERVQLMVRKSAMTSHQPAQQIARAQVLLEHLTGGGTPVQRAQGGPVRMQFESAIAQPNTMVRQMLDLSAKKQSLQLQRGERELMVFGESQEVMSEGGGGVGHSFA